MPRADAAEELAHLGFTDLEARAYAFLVASGPATGYRVAQGIAKPVANTYKALDSLRRKGAVAIEQGDSRRVRAIPPDELLERLGREFEERRERAAQALRELGPTPPQAGVVPLPSADLALAKARILVAGAREVLLVSGVAEAVASLEAELEEAVRRGVDVVARTSAALAEVTTIPPGPPAFAGELRLVADRREVLFAAMREGDFGFAIASAEEDLARATHAGLAAEFTLALLAERIEDGAGPKRLARALEQHRAVTGGHGYPAP